MKLRPIRIGYMVELDIRQKYPPLQRRPSWAINFVDEKKEKNEISALRLRIFHPDVSKIDILLICTSHRIHYSI